MRDETNKQTNKNGIKKINRKLSVLYHCNYSYGS